MKDCLKKIFLNRFEEFSKNEKNWINYLNRLGVNRSGKLMAMIISCPQNQIEFQDPAREDALIRINKELALKIATLGFIPEEK